MLMAVEYKLRPYGAYRGPVQRPDDETPLGAVCGPIKTQFGYHLLQVVERSEKSA